MQIINCSNSPFLITPEIHNSLQMIEDIFQSHNTTFLLEENTEAIKTFEIIFSTDKRFCICFDSIEGDFCTLVMIKNRHNLTLKDVYINSWSLNSINFQNIIEFVKQKIDTF